jgi:hypothetical protein
VQGVPTPGPPAAPTTDVDQKASEILGYLRWAVLLVIFAAGFVGAAAIAGGRFMGHAGWSRTGTGILLGALTGAVAYAVIYGFLQALSGAK